MLDTKKGLLRGVKMGFCRWWNVAVQQRAAKKLLRALDVCETMLCTSTAPCITVNLTTKMQSNHSN